MVTAVGVDSATLIETVKAFGRDFVNVDCGVYEVHPELVDGEVALVVAIDQRGTTTRLPERYNGLPVLARPGEPGILATI